VLDRQWPHARRRREYRAAFAAGNQFWRDFYADRVVEEIRASLRLAGQRRRAVAWGLELARLNPRVVPLHLFRKLRNVASQAVRGQAWGRDRLP
jgi:hypothetical protein